MKCNNCGRKLPRNSKFCPECGEKVEYDAEDKRLSFDDDVENSITEDEKEPKYNYIDDNEREIEEKASVLSLKLAIFGGGAVVAVALIILIVILVSSVSSDKASTNVTDSKTADAEHVETDEEKEKRLCAEIDKIYDAFSSGAMSYDDAQAKVQGYYSEKLVSNYAIEINNRMTEDHLYSGSMEQAQEYYNNSAWVDAINSYRTALEHKADDAEANKGLQDSIEKYKEQINSEIASAVEKDDYDSALQILSTAMTVLPEDEDLKAKETEVNEAKAAYLQRLHEEKMRGITAEADEMIKNKEWDDALDHIKKALKEYPDDPILMEKYNYIKNNMPMNLTNVDMYDESGVVRNRGYIKDKQGNSYKNYVRFAATNNAKAKFRLNKAYTKLTLTLFVDKDAAPGKLITVTILADGVPKSFQADMTENTLAITIDVNVKDVQTLEITTLNTGTSGGGFLYLAGTSFVRK